MSTAACRGLDEADPTTLPTAQFEAQQLRKQVNALQKDLGKCMRVRRDAHGTPNKDEGSRTD